MEIRYENVSAGYDYRDALHEINFHLSPGRNLSIIGANGSGKTTLLRTLASLLPYQGHITVNGRELNSFKRKEAASIFAMVPQFSQNYFSYSVMDTVVMGRYIHGRGLSFPSGKDIEISRKYMKLTDIDDLKERSLDTLSGGQRQRVFLARAMAQETPVILLDEPTNHLDLMYQKELLDYLKEWSRQSTDTDYGCIQNTVIAVFHDISSAYDTADDILMMKNGRVLASGAKEEVFTRDNLKQTFQMDIIDEMQRRSEVLQNL